MLTPLYKTDDVAGASDAHPAGCCLKTIKVFHTRAVFLTHVRLDESKVFPFLHGWKHLKVYKSVRLQKTAFCRGGAARVGNVFLVQHKYTTKKFQLPGGAGQSNKKQGRATRKRANLNQDTTTSTQCKRSQPHQQQTHSIQLKSAKHMSNDAQQLCMG